jgi:hypothetical protein
VFCSVPQYRSYVEANGRLDVLAISLQLPFSLLQKLLPTRQTRNLLQHATALHIPKFLLLPQVLSVAATSVCLSEQLTEHLLQKLDVEKILIKFKEFMKHEYSEKREKFLASLFQ